MTVTITTINGSDLITNSRAVLNANFMSLNTGKVDITTTINGHALGSNITITPSDIGSPSGSGTSTGTNTGDQNLSSYAPLASPTFTGIVSLPTGTILVNAVLTGLPTGSGVSSSATASTLTARDANGNIMSNSFIQGYTTTVTSGATTTLTVSSSQLQYFTGTSTQTVAMPVASTLALGMVYNIVNLTNQGVIIQSSGANNIVVLGAGKRAILTCILTSGTTAASWDSQYFGVVISSGKNLSINNSFTFSGTDNTTITFPGTSATLARTDAAQTFSGQQTYSSSVILSQITLVDGATVALDASLGNQFTLSASGDRTILVPTNPSSGLRFTIRHFANGGARTLTLTSGANGFAFGSGITSLTQTASGKYDYIDCIWNGTSGHWDVVNYQKGY